MNKRSDKQPSASDAVLGSNFQKDKQPSATDAVLGDNSQAHPRSGELTTYEFDLVKLDAQGNLISRERRQAQCFPEDLGDGIGLEMVLIPGGTFVMGSSKDELGGFDTERPQHTVTIQPFCLGKYPVTQAQWKAVAAWPQVKRHLDPDPSRLKGVNRPVESVSWLEAVEFCQRLTQKTGRKCCLPSEAQWEYACRAGTTTPFHFGETITPELANYDGQYNYSVGTKRMYRGETTDVGSFSVANAFGLYDMHGLVSEWCADLWHDNYQGAPTDGRAWLYDNDDQTYGGRVLRGGSWNSYPGPCRSASRYGVDAGLRNINIGFRVGYGARNLAGSGNLTDSKHFVKRLLSGWGKRLMRHLN
jgi:formylglycine-generating enzyme required for sulfatase activity